ncbi:MAG: indole-3-glycerol phosphate synthase TrpC [Bacteroidota bacterium]
MSLLDSIVEHKRQEVEEKKREVDLGSFRDSPAYAARTLSLVSALRSRRPAIIAEIKKASPSKHVIREEFQPESIAKQYAGGGAAAISVLTDHSYFRGNLEYIKQVKKVVDLPILRKDFILDPYQIHESKAAGADAVLLIAAILTPDLLIELKELATELGMESLVEVHTEDELSSLSQYSFDIIGINNRDLATFETDLDVSIRLVKHVPDGAVVVSESGISRPEDLQKLMNHGIHAMLIGEYFMRSADPGMALSQLLSEVVVDG